MIRYTYECMECHRIWTEDLPMEKRNDPLKGPCPYCEEGKVKRIYTTQFLLKGDGWAKDGYSGFLGDDPNWKRNKWDHRELKDE